MATGVIKTISKSTGSSNNAGSNQKSPGMVVVPDDFTVDKEARFTGTVSSFNKWRGFGHIVMDQKGVVPGDSLFVHWKNIQTDDRFPRLKEGLQLEFGVMVSMEWKSWKKVKSVKAKTVTLPGGGMVNLQDSMDAEKKTFVGAQNFRYTGQLKFFDQFRGFGWVILDDGFAMDDPVPKEIKVESTELNLGGKPLRSRLAELAIEFGIVKSRRGDQYLAYNVTLPGGHAITQENLEHRQEVAAGQKFSGIISWFNWRQGWGHITPDPAAVLPEQVQKKLDETAAAALKAKPTEAPEKLLYFRKADCDWNMKPEEGTKVKYTVYVDDKGAGAENVEAVSADTDMKV